MSAGEDVEKQDCWERKTVQLLCKTVGQFLKVLNGVPHNPAVPLLNTKPKELKTYVHIRVYSHTASDYPKSQHKLNVHQNRNTTEHCLTMKTMYDTCYSTGEVKDANHKRSHIR